MNPRSRKLAPTLGLALVFAVSGAPTATGSGDNGSGLDPWAYAAIHDSKTTQPMSENTNDLRDLDPWAYSRVLLSRSSTPRGENATGQQPTTAAIRPNDRPGIRGPATPIALLQLGRASDRGTFDWRDAGIGGAAMLALVLLVRGGAMLRHDSRRQEAHG